MLYLCGLVTFVQATLSQQTAIASYFSTSLLMRLKAAITAAIAFTALNAAADGFSGEKTLGLQAGYTTYNRTAVAGMEFTYRFSRNFRIAPSANYVFRHQNTDALQINLNAHVPFPFASRWEVFPLAGLNYSSWNYHNGTSAPNDDADVSNRVSRFGLNIGAGIGFAATPTLRLSLTADYIAIKHFSGTNILAKIAYRF